MICIGDIHGGFKTLLKLIEKLPTDTRICFVGDLIDRGPKSMEVVDFVIKNNYDCVMGNHEQMMIDVEYYKDELASGDMWYRNGGKTTITNYHGHNDIMEQHVEWMRTLPLVKEYPDEGLVVSHSSAAEYYKSGKSLDKAKGVLGHRASFPKKIPGLYNVFGHTWRQNILLKDHFANIDTGMASRKKLTALKFPEMEIYEQYYLDYDDPYHLK